MEYQVQAIALLNEWQQYKRVHYSTKTQFNDAVEIEIEKGAADQLSVMLREELQKEIVNDHELEYLTTRFEQHMAILKDRITFELLKHGNSTNG